MNQALALDTARIGMQTALLVSLPILGTSLLIGLMVSLFQAVTQVQEATLTFVPKLLGVGLATVLLGNWMLITMIHFVQLCFMRAANLGLH